MTEADPNPEVEISALNDIRGQIPAWSEVLRLLLPSLPAEFDTEVTATEPLDYTFYKERGWNYGTGGPTPTPNSVVLEVDTVTDIPRAQLLDSAKATFFHESLHLARGYSFESTDLSLMDVATEEGMGTKFEIDKAGSHPIYGHHQDRETMLATLEEVRKADLDEVKDWQRWKHHDPDTDRHWILYRVGTFIAEEVLANNHGVEIQDLAMMTRQEILGLSRL